MPFISALGYDVFNPFEVIPEFTADTGTKKGEKVDYAIKKDDEIIMLIECKSSGTDLHKNHKSQLFRYFSVTNARFAILTNGINYEFYSDIDKPNKMDSEPFFEFNILEFEDFQLEEMKKFTKSAFSLEDILNTASTLKYTGQIKQILEKELNDPSPEFVLYFTDKIYDGRKTQRVIEQFTKIVRNARKQFVEERITERFKEASKLGEPAESIDTSIETTDIETTQDEIDAYNIVKAILCEKVDVERVAIRDAKSYCSVFLDDNNRKPICRFYFDGKQKYITVTVNNQEERININSVSEIYKHSDKIKQMIALYE